jgi:oxygen-independent coproporphyrinogen-3 oxidase
VEHGTPLEKLVKHGILPEPDQDVAGEMYEWSMEILAQRGFVHYEISNWAKKDAQGRGLESLHNCQYWLNRPYFGFGAGAHGFVGGRRTANVLAPARYIMRMKEEKTVRFPRTPATSTVRVIDRRTEMQETMMMGLRLLESGVSQERFVDRFGQRIEQVFGKEVEKLVRLGLLTWLTEDEDRLVLTRKGCLLGNQVFIEFV